MLLLNADQVVPCKVVRQTVHLTQVLRGVAFQDKLFAPVAEYPLCQREQAIRAARKRYDEDGSTLILVVSESAQVTVWHEERELSRYEGGPHPTPNGQELPSLEAIARMMHGPDGVPIRHRWMKFKLHTRCFLGHEASVWLSQTFSISRDRALQIGQQLIEQKWIHALEASPEGIGFRDEAIAYRFYMDEL